MTRTFHVQRMTGGVWAPISGADLDLYVTNPASTVNATDNQYWELWDVDGHGNVSDGGEDTFGLCSLIPNDTQYHDTTKGSFVITGEAHFYPTVVTPVMLGFTKSAVAAAGGLYSRSTDPAVGAAGLVAAGPPVTYTVTVTWDSTGKPGGVGAKRKPGGIYTPRAAWSTVTES